jgi:hypothetical protein
MCNGTMSQLTSGPHSPIVAPPGSGSTVTGDEVTDAVPELNSSVCSPVPAMPRSAKVAVPLASVVAVVVPSRVPPPEAMVAVTSASATGLPLPSCSTTTGCAAGSNTSWSRAETGGLVVIARPSGSGSPTVEVNVTDPSTPAAVAVVVCGPIVDPRVRCTEARPFAPVATEAADTVPPPCALQLTVTFPTGSPLSSVTRTTSGSGSV